MSNKQKLRSINGLDKASIEEIIRHFSFIDKKIFSLHDYSSEDFLNLNRILKDYFNRIKLLSDNSNSVIESISGKCFNEFANKLNTLHNDLNSPMLKMEENLNLRINTLEKTLKILDYIYVPINNLKQNLMTLKLVLASAKLNRNLFREEADAISEYAQIADDLDEKIKKLYISIEQSLKTLKSEIKDSLIQQYHLKDKTLNEVNSIKFNIQSSIHLISENYKDIFSEIPQITEQAQLCFKNIDQIITNLQYHDIIRQKMDHIQEIQKDIVEDLNNYDKQGENTQPKYINNIPHVAELQVAQLMLTNKEYQNAIAKITSELLDIYDKIQTITNISLKISVECKNSRKNNETDLTKKEAQFNNILDNANIESNEFNSSIQKLNAHNLQLSDLFIKISGFESDLDKLDLFLSSQNKKSDKFKELAKITSALIDDIKFKNKEVQELSKQVKQNISLLENQTSDLSDNNIAALQDFGKGLFKSLMSNIKDYTTDIGNQLYKNIDISNNISEDIKASINNIKYYQLFEKIIEEIIEKLNGINQILRNKNILNVNEDGVSDLNLLKEKYTMQSERDIHDQILNKEKELGIKSKKEEEDQGDLELF
jgi:hypothetical protein